MPLPRPMNPQSTLPERGPAGPPFTLRCRLLTPLTDGGTRYLADAAIAVDHAGRIEWLGEWPAWR
ncbi:MAG TPA: hypothetical protein VK992_06000, partial [Candidatus Caenarcaniphilales bacterium]|nr:hypothetical protein [Candidatus Caenarcaniphilales bacterium]